ncbi:response regulator, partial [Candidatus Omnitrophota bacterium]
GLATVKGIVKEHNGTIEVESTLGEGTTFTVTMPLRSAAEKSEEALKPPTAKTGREIKTVLVVAGENNITMLWRFHFDKLGVEVVTADSEAEALTLMGTKSFDAIITDLQMNLPEKEGLKSEEEGPKPEEEGLRFAVEARKRGFKGPIAVFDEGDPKVKRLEEEDFINLTISKGGEVYNKRNMENIIEKLKSVTVVPPKEDKINKYKGAIDSKRKSIFDEEFIVDESDLRHAIMNSVAAVVGYISFLKESEKSLMEKLTGIKQGLSDLEKKTLEFPKKITGSREEIVDAMSEVVGVYRAMSDALREIGKETKKNKTSLAGQPKKDLAENIERIEKAASETIDMLEEFLAKSKQRLESFEKKKGTTEKTSKKVKTLLVVDDAPDISALWEIVLKNSEIEVVTAKSMKEALQVINERIEQKKPVDAIITDLNMPSKREGIMLAEEARKGGFTGPIAIFTGVDKNDLQLISLRDKGIINLVEPKIGLPVDMRKIVDKLKRIAHEEGIEGKKSDDSAQREAGAKFMKEKQTRENRAAAAKGALPKPMESTDIQTMIQDEKLSELSPKVKASELQVASAEKVALIYGNISEEDANDKLNIIGFKGEVVVARTRDMLEKHLNSDEHFDVIINMSSMKDKEFKELVEEILFGLDKSIPIVNGIDKEHNLQDTLLTICA